MTTFRHRWLQGKSRVGKDPTRLVGGSYDVIVMTSSWDSRCLCLTDCGLEADVAVGLFFSYRGTGALRARHDPIVRDYLDRSAPILHELEYPSEATDELWAELWQRIEDAAVAKGSQLRVLFDLSTCPRFYAMALVANSFRSQLVSELTVFYAEGNYPARPIDDPHELFTAGRWETIPVPGLEGDSEPGRLRRYVVAVGFEGTKTMRAVGSEGADTVSVILPKPAVRKEYEAQTLRDNQTLLTEFAIAAGDIHPSPAGDAIETWRRLEGIAAQWRDDDVFYLPCGTKPHAVGMALHSLTSGRASVMYAKPASHKEAETTPLGKYWSYEMRDLTAPPVPARR